MKRVITTILCVFFMIAITLVTFIIREIRKAYAPFDSSVELDWILESDKITDSTNQHMQNLWENYQTLEDSTLLLDNLNMPERVGTLYRYNNETKVEQMIAGNVLNFLELNDEIYYFTYQEKKGSYKLKCFDKKRKKTITLLTHKEHDIESVWHISEEKIYYLTMEYKLMCYDQVTKKSEQCMYYDFMGYPYKVFFYEDKFLICANGVVQLVDVREKRTKRIIDEEYLSNNSMVGCGNKVYVAINPYVIGGNYEHEEKESENVGLWEINMDTLEKKKINSERYDGLYLRNGILYDGNFRKIKFNK